MIIIIIIKGIIIIRRIVLNREWSVELLGIKLLWNKKIFEKSRSLNLTKEYYYNKKI